VVLGLDLLLAQQQEAAQAPLHSGLMPADLSTLPHFSVSSARSLPNSVGVIGRGTVPRSASRAFIPGSASAALISLLSRSTMPVGVFLGAPRPTKKVAS